MQSSAKHIAELLKEIVKDNGWEQDIASNKIPQLWYELLGEKGREITVFKRFDEGKMYIHVQSAPWRSELTLRKQEFISKINSHFGFSLVKDIIFR
jgi:predicted nucleic acid-binding Zn ribbon protein